MSTNCLVTKLKGSVDNNNLPVLGCVNMITSLSSSGSDLVIQSNTSVRPVSGKLLPITILSEGVTITSAANNAVMIDSKHGKLSSAYNSRLVLSGVTADSLVNILVGEKYDIEYIYPVRSSNIDLSELMYCSNLKILRVGVNSTENNISGDISNLSELTTITEISIGFVENVYGDITSLGKLVNLATFGIGNTLNHISKMSGTWDGFVAAQRLNGRISCDGITIKNADYSRNILLGDVSPIFDDYEAANGTLMWTADTIDFYLTSKNKAYVIGYTQEEIDALKESGQRYYGYTVVKCD